MQSAPLGDYLKNSLPQSILPTSLKKLGKRFSHRSPCWTPSHATLCQRAGLMVLLFFAMKGFFMTKREVNIDGAVNRETAMMLLQELRDMEERLVDETMANEVRSTFSCKYVRPKYNNPLYNTRRAEAPWYNFRSRKVKQSMIAYSGMRIYPEPRMSNDISISQHVTIVAHLTIDRLIRLRTLIARIDATTTRVSVAVYVPHHLKTIFWGNHRKAREEVYEEIGCGLSSSGYLMKGSMGDEGRGCSFVDVHIVYVDTVDQTNAWCVDFKGITSVTPDVCLYYPIQQLRNIAMSFVRTEYTMSIDIDFIPSSHGLFSRALTEIRKFEHKIGRNPRRAFVINLQDSVCDSSGTFDGCKPGGMLMPDHPSHAPSYKTPIPWIESKEPQAVNYEFAYEPYFVSVTEELPLYDERFWYGNDKVQQCYDTAAAGFNFFVLPPSVGSLIHWEHEEKSTFKQPPLAITRGAMGLLASVVRRAECAWPGTRDQFICENNHVRRNTWWYKLLTPAFYKVAGCTNTEQRLFRTSHTLKEEQNAGQAASAARAFADALDSKNYERLRQG